MFYFIKGTLALLKPGFAVIDAAGVGYRLTISDRTYGALAGRVNGEVMLLSHLSVREDGVELFGFMNESEQETFLLLTGVSGVGPKGAMSILSQFTPEQFTLAVCAEDKKAIAKASGVGPKLAARIILELHDKLASGGALPDLGAADTADGSPAQTGNSLRDAQEALLVLGYNRTEVLAALQGLNTTAMTSEEIIRAALKKLMR